MKVKNINTRKITGMAIMSAFSLVLVAIPFLRFAPFPIAPFLEYDAADIPIMLATFIYGPMCGLIVTLVVAVIQGLAFSVGGGVIGILMHIMATGTFVLTGGVLFKYLNTKTKLKPIASLSASIGVGAVAWVISMVIYNVIFTPLFMGVPLEGVLEIMLPAIVPFNLIKVGINSVVGAILYLSLHKMIAKYLDKKPLTDEEVAELEKQNVLCDNPNVDSTTTDIPPDSVVENTEENNL